MMAILFTFHWSQASAKIPINLTASDQSRILEVLGFGTAAKSLHHVYPLGGNLGISLSLANQFIPFDDVANLGNKTKDSSEYKFTTLTLSKGLYYDVDISFYFTPPGQSEDLTNFGAQGSWQFYKAHFFPISFTVASYAGAANFNNLINVTTFGTDLIATVAIDNLAFYVGSGRIHAKGIFIGATTIANGITASGLTESVSFDTAHNLIGLNFNMDRFDMALELNRYTDSVYGAKLSYHF